MYIKKITSAIRDRTILKKIKYKIKSSIFFLLVKLSLFINYPKLTALIFAMIASKVNASGDFTVLCFGRSVFLNDVNALATFGKRIKYLVIYKDYFRMILEHFMEESEKKLLTERTYHTHNFCQEGKKKYNLYLAKMLPVLRKLIGFDAVLSGNFAYPEQQELEDVCTKEEIPFIVLHKEGLIIPDSEKEWANIYKVYKFRGAKALFYNKKFLRLLLDSKFSRISEDNAKVVGMPRLDFYFPLAKKENKDLNKRVVFFSFYPDDKVIGLINDSEKIKEVKRRIDNFHKWVMNFAARHEDIEVIIKTRLAGHYPEYVNKILKDNFKESINNLVITSVGSPFELIRDSMAVISFNSTTCIKAIVANRVLISPHFGDLIPDKPWDYFGKYPELVNYAKTEEDLKEYILNYKKYLNYNLDNKKEFLEELVGNSDGQASIRAENAIIETIKEFQNAQ